MTGTAGEEARAENTILPAGEDLPGQADVEYFTTVQAGAWGDMLRAFVRFADLPPGLRVLDAGTGPGLLARLLAYAGAGSVVGCDDSPAMLERAQRLAQGTGSRETGGAAATPAAAWRQPPLWAVSAVQRLAFAGGAFDAALATNLLFLLPDPAAGLLELVRVVRPGGCVAFLNPGDGMSRAAAQAFLDGRGTSGPDRFSFLNYARLAEGHHRLSEGTWRSLAETAGLRALRTAARAGGMVLFMSGFRR